MIPDEEGDGVDVDVLSVVGVVLDGVEVEGLGVVGPVPGIHWPSMILLDSIEPIDSKADDNSLTIIGILSKAV